MQTERLTLSVSQLNAEVGQLLAHGFPALWVEGEISNFVRASSGHLYFSLKDAGAQVRCAMFKGRASTLKLAPKNGLKVLVRGKVALYEPRGEYQFIIEHLEDAGVGILQRQFEELKQQLQAQGLFAIEHKQTLPTLPRCIGVITSPTGAAIRDILNVLKRRCPQIPVMVYPVLVQGEGSKEQIVNAIRQADREQYCDVLILARGGGSIEDLWSFNEAVVAHAIHACKLPIISGVGHEIDFTIAVSWQIFAPPRPPPPQNWSAPIEKPCKRTYNGCFPNCNATSNAARNSRVNTYAACNAVWKINAPPIACSKKRNGWMNWTCVSVPRHNVTCYASKIRCRCRQASCTHSAR